MLNDFECWATDCGTELSEEDMWTVTWELDGKYCPWCGEPITLDDSEYMADAFETEVVA